MKNKMTALTSEELITLSNQQIAMRLLLVLTNKTDKGLDDVLEITKELQHLALHYRKGV